MRIHERKQGVGVVGRQIAQPHILERSGCVPPVTCVALVLVPQRVGFRVYDLVGSRMLKSSSPHGAFLTDLTGYPPGSNAQNSATQFVQDENAHGKRADAWTGCTLVPPIECCEDELLAASSEQLSVQSV